MESTNLFSKSKRKERYMVTSVKIFFVDIFGSQYLFEILQTSLTVKNSENVVKSGCFEERLRWRVPTFFRSEGGI